MLRYAKDLNELDCSTLVSWNGQIYGLWDVYRNRMAKLIPWDMLIRCDGDEEAWERSAISVPIRQIQVLEPIQADAQVVRALFRLDKMPWELAQEGLFPFSSATRRYAFTEEDLLCLIERLPLFKNCFLLEAWRRSFFTRSDGIIGSPIEMPVSDRHCFTFALLAHFFFSMMEWFDPTEEDWKDIYELRDLYLRSKGKPLAQVMFPDRFKGVMLTFLEDHAKTHALNAKLVEYYTGLLEERYREGSTDGIKDYAYAYYGGNGIVPCDWRRSEQALLKLFDIDADPPTGDMWAANSLGYIYYSERLGAPDLSKAFLCFRYAASRGVIEAIYKLSDMYRLGHGVKADPEKAWTLLNMLYRNMDKRHIAEGKNADILLRMGYCYRDGSGVARDPARALHYFRQAKRAITERMKWYSNYGDSTVARNIDAAIESVKTASDKNGADQE